MMYFARALPASVAFFCSLLLHGQDWRELYKQAETHYAAAALEPARAAAEETLQAYVRESGETNDSYAAILRLLVSIYSDLEQPGKGLEYALKEVQLREPKRDEALATALANAAMLYQQLDQPDRAIALLQQAEKIQLDFYPADDPTVLAIRLSLAINHYLVNQNQSALTIFQDLFKNKSKLQQDSETLRAWYYHGLLHMELNKLQEAIYILLEGEQKYLEAQAHESYEFVALLQSLAEAYYQYQLYYKADEANDRALALVAKLQLPADELVFKLWSGKSNTLFALQRDAEAEQWLQKLAAAKDARPTYAQTLGIKAGVWQNRGREAEAEKIYTRALELIDKNKAEEAEIYIGISDKAGMLYAKLGQPEKATTLGNEAVALALTHFGENSVGYARALTKKGSLQLQLQRADDALLSFGQAWAVLQPLPPQHEVVLVQSGMAQAYQQKGQFGHADSLYARALAQYKEGRLTPDPYLPVLLGRYASLQEAQGKWLAARDLMQQAAAEIRKVRGREHDQYSSALENLALLNLRLGNRQLAKSQLDSAAMLFGTDARKNSAAYASLLLNLGRFHQAAGDYTEAEPLIKQSVARFKAVDEKGEGYANALNTLALLYQTLGNFAEAQPLLTQALELTAQRNGKKSLAYATILQNLATLYQLEEKYDLSEQLLTEANAIDRQVLGSNSPQYAVSLQNLATLYQKKKNTQRATELLGEVKSVFESTVGVRHPSYATVVSNLAALYQDQGNYGQSEKFWRESVSLRKELFGEDHPEYARALFGLASIYFATDRYDEARGYFELVIAKYQSQIGSYFAALSEKEKGAFYARIKPVFEAYQDFCVQNIARQKNTAEMAAELFNLQLSTKAILLNASNKVRNVIANSTDADLKNMYREWLSTKEALVGIYNLTAEERQKTGADPRQLEARANDLEKQLSARSELFGQQATSAAPRWQQVQQALKNNEIAIEIMRIRKKYTADSIYYAALIVTPTAGAPQLMIWPHGQTLENRWFRYHRNHIKFQLKDTLSYKFFWQPLVAFVPANATVYLSCDGVFNKINFNTLQNPASQRYVLDDYTIRTISNTRELLEVSTEVNRSTAVASIFGHVDFNLSEANTVSGSRRAASRFGFKGEDIPMLPATEAEVNLLQNLLRANQWQANVFTLEHATEENLKKVSSPVLLHVATHGFFLSDVDIDHSISSDENSFAQNPLLRSGILLAGAGVAQGTGGEDGVLTAYEAMNLNLDQTELVSLSACETGLGEVRNGEGVYGLQRSFLVAGARSLLMSLWQVDDAATQELMTSFYSLWMAGQPKIEAFRKAQQEIKNKYEAPYFWGAFVLIGR